MNRSSTKIAVALAVVAGALAAPAGYAAVSPADGRSPDTRDAALRARQTAMPDVFERYVLSHQPTIVPPADRRSPDTKDAAAAAASSGTISDGRSPDTRDAAQAPKPAEFASPAANGFAWGELGIGVAAALALLLLLAGATLVLSARSRRAHATHA